MILSFPPPYIQEARVYITSESETDLPVSHIDVLFRMQAVGTISLSPFYPYLHSLSPRPH